MEKFVLFRTVSNNSSFNFCIYRFLKIENEDRYGQTHVTWMRRATVRFPQTVIELRKNWIMLVSFMPMLFNFKKDGLRCLFHKSLTVQPPNLLNNTPDPSFFETKYCSNRSGQ